MPKTATKPPKKSTPRTATFNKVITRPDTYDIPDGTGKKVKRELNAEELRKVAENINAQIEAGHKIPAPFKHYVKDGDKNKLFLQDVLLDGSPVDRFMFDPSINAGYWKKAQFVDDCSKIDPSFEAGPGLVGTIEAPGDPNDPNTPAGKIGT